MKFIKTYPSASATRPGAAVGTATRKYAIMLAMGLTASIASAVLAAVETPIGREGRVSNSFVTVEGEGVGVLDDGSISYDEGATGDIIVTARPGWRVNGQKSVTLNPARGSRQPLGATSDLHEDQEHIHFFPRSESEEHVPDSHMEIFAEANPASAITMYALPDTSTVVTVSANVYLMRSALHRKVAKYGKCWCGQARDPEIEYGLPYAVKPDRYEWTASGAGLSFHDSTWTGEMSKGLAQKIEFTVKAKRSSCTECDCEAKAEATVDVYEVSIERPDYVGLDMTDAKRGEYIYKSATAKIDPAPAVAEYVWQECGRCEFYGATDKAGVTYRANDKTGPSGNFLEEKLIVQATARNKDGLYADANCKTNFTVVKVDVSLDNWGEMADELGLSKVPAFVMNARGRFSRKAYDNLSRHKVSVDIIPEGMPGDELVSFIYSGNYVLENNPISDTAKCLFEGAESSDWLSGGLLTLSVPYANHQYSIEELAGQSFSLLGTSVGLQEILAQHRKSEAQDKVVYDVYCCRVTICTDSLGGTTFNTLVDVGHSFWKLEIDPAHFDMIPVDLRRYACAYMGFYPANEIDNYVLSQEGALHYESQLPARHDSRLEDGAQGTAKHTWFVTIDDLIAGLRAVHSLKNRSYNLAVFNCTDAALMVVNACGIGTNWSAMGLTYKSPLELYHAITAINGVVGGVE